MATELWSAALIIFSTLLSSSGSILLKKASEKLSFSLKTILHMPLLVGFGFHVISALVSIIAYKGGELSVLFSLGALNYIWVSIFSVKYLGEKMNKWKWLGVLSIIFGVVLVGIGAR